MSETIRVIIVNDDKKIAEMWRKYVDKQPDMESPTTAYNGDESITLAEEYQPDVMVMDVMMPGTVDGIEATRQIVGMGHGTKIIVYSGRTDIEPKARDAGAVKFMSLPILPDELIRAIREVAGK